MPLALVLNSKEAIPTFLAISGAAVPSEELGTLAT